MLGYHMFFDIINHIHELGTAARRATGLYGQLQCYARASYMFFNIILSSRTKKYKTKPPSAVHALSEGGSVLQGVSGSYII